MSCPCSSKHCLDCDLFKCVMALRIVVDLLASATWTDVIAD
jgi:hypothetical protein